jgi:regulator of sirC expression with transglutaminase-like and TPR domain
LNLSAKLRKALVEIGQLPDDNLDLAETALLLAKADRPEVQLDSYQRHLVSLCDDVGGYISGFPTPLSLEICHEALVQVLFRRYGYVGGEDCIDDPEAANLTHVIDRRSGLPVVLGTLYIHVAHQLGWNAEGLNFPGRFLLRLEVNSERLILDPFAGGVAINTLDLRGILKDISGHHAELQPEYYQTLTAREILLRIQNNIRGRMLRLDRVEDAIAVIDTMLLFAPKVTYLWREKAVLLARIDLIPEAIIALEFFLKYDYGMDSRYKASMLLQELRQRLN